MRKIYFFYVLLFCNLSLFAQEFQFTQNGLNPEYIVVDIPNKSQNEIYQNALGWIKETFNSDKVIQSTIENNKIRFEGISEKKYCTKTLGMMDCSDVKYLIDLEFKNDKYRIELVDFKFYVAPSKYSPRFGWVDVNTKDVTMQYNKKGEMKSRFIPLAESITSTMNSLNLSLKNYILNDSANKLNSDW